MDDAQLAQRFAALEAQVKLLSDQLGVACPPFAGAAASTPEAGSTMDGVPDEVVELARAGKTTQAISRQRQLTGATLLEAKKIVDRL